MNRSYRPSFIRPSFIRARALVWTVALALAGLAFAPGAARADFQFTTVSGAKDSDGSLSAEAYFTLQNGQITLYLANFISGTQGQGQAISGITFTVSTPPNTSLSLNTVSGNVVENPGVKNQLFTQDGYKTYTALSNPATANWAAVSTNDVTDLGSGTPQFLIVGPNASFSGNGGTNFNPYFQSTATSVENLDEASQGSGVKFVLSAPGLTTASTISDVTLFFGTGPDGSSKTNGGFVTPAPEPSGLMLVGSGGLSLLAFIALPRRRRAPVAAA